MKRILIASLSLLAAPPVLAGDWSYEDQAVQPPVISSVASELSPEQLRLVQRALAAQGFTVSVTGDLDVQTRTGLMCFQQAHQLGSSGDLDGSTVQALGLDPREVMPVRGPSGQPAPRERAPIPEDFHRGG